MFNNIFGGMNGQKFQNISTIGSHCSWQSQPVRQGSVWQDSAVSTGSLEAHVWRLYKPFGNHSVAEPPSVSDVFYCE